jgi:hypothetical protein
VSTLHRRLEKLEKILAPSVAKDAGWGSLAVYRDQLLGEAKKRGEPVSDLKMQLDAMGPQGFWREVIRSYLDDHGFVQQAQESLAETTARALGIRVKQLVFCIEDGSVGRMLLGRFAGTKVATDNGS